MEKKNRDEYYKAYYQANKKKYAERGKAWRAENPDKALALDRKWKAKNHDKIVKYRERTKEKRNTWQREYEATRRDKEKAREASDRWRAKYAKAYHQKWRDENPGKCAAYTASRRARKFYATPLWLTDEDLLEMEEKYLQASNAGLEVDHIVPLAGKTVCGLHVPWNLQLVSRTDNARKSNKLPPEYDYAALSVSA